MDNFLCIIPARGGSKRLPKKNIKIFADKPLIAWTIEAGLRSNHADKVVVSTDDPQIEKIANEYGVEVILRPPELASDTASTVDVIIHTLDYLDSARRYIPDYVVLLQCTSPLRTEKHVNEAINMFLNTKAKTLISLTKEKHPPWWLRLIKEDGYTERYFNRDLTNDFRKQDSINLYKPNGAIYIAKHEVIKNNKTFQTDKTIPYIMDSYSSIDIDTEEDFKLAEFFFRNKKK